MPEQESSASLEGLVLEAVEWLPSGSDAGLLRVRGVWSDLDRREEGLPALGLRRGGEARSFESLPDARFGRDPAVWRGTYLIPAALMDPAPEELWLSWESGAQARLPEPARAFDPPAVPTPTAAPDPGGEVIDRGVLAERRARRAEAAERAQAQRAAEALKAVEVLELRSAELERRLEALQSESQGEAESQPDAGATAAPEEALAGADAATGSTAAPEEASAATAADAAIITLPATGAAVPEPDADATAAALTEAVATVKRLRHQLGEHRQRLRKSELLRAADAVALASVRETASRARRLEQELAARERELAAALAAADEHAAEAAAAREQAADQVAQAARRSAADAAAVRQRAEAEIAAARAALTATRDELGAAQRDLSAERTAHEQTRARLAERERELAAIGAELAGVRAELATVRDDAAARAAALERRLTELDAALAEERRAHGIAATERETARARLAHAESLRSAESVARAALDDELDRERLARATLTSALQAAQSELTAARATNSDLVLSREQARTEAASAKAELEAARGLRAELAAANARAAELERELEAARAALEDADHEAGGLMARIAELERAADDDLERRARAQADAAAAVARPTPEERRDVSASIDAAASALKARADEVEPPVARGEPAEIETSAAPGESAAGAEAPAAPAGSAAGGGEATESQRESAAGAQATATPGDSAAAAKADVSEAGAPPARPRVFTEATHPSRADVVGSSRREYPWLRGALVKLAHDDPRVATRLVLGLVPAQRALVQPPLEYDLTIRGSGTYAISIAQEGAAARSIGGPRPRAAAAFHVAADIVTLAEVLAGVDKRMGRWLGSVRVRGRRRAAEALRAALKGATLDLAGAARAGADLDPDLVFRAFAYAIHPSWTRGHSFTVAQEITGARPMRWHIAVRDGAPVAVERRAPKEPPDAVVSMSRTAFSHMLRGEPLASGDRPAIRGDREAVALLKAWTDRAQGRAG